MNNPFTANLSIGGGLFSSGTCPTLINTVVSNLTSRGVPVIAATGNNGNSTQISWPACASNVIKVSSVRNDATGTTKSSFANIGSQSSFTGPFLLAPGGGDGTNVRSSSRTTTTSTMLMSGTSMAAPHAAGIYAGIKATNPSGVDVASVTAWIVSTGSIPVTIGSETYRRIRLP